MYTNAWHHLDTDIDVLIYYGIIVTACSVLVVNTSARSLKLFVKEWLLICECSISIQQKLYSSYYVNVYNISVRVF